MNAIILRFLGLWSASLLLLALPVRAQVAASISAGIGVVPADLVAPVRIDPALASGPRRITPHPRLEPDGRIATKQLGDFGESFVDAELRARGFEVIDGNVGGKGIDWIAFKRGSNGEMTDVRFIEVKTRQSIPDFKLGVTKDHGLQLSDAWTEDNLGRIAAEHPNPHVRQLAGEILERTKLQPKIVSRELHGIAVKSNRYVVRSVNASGQIEGISADGRLTDLLDQLSTRGTSEETRAAAMKHLSQFDQLHTAGATEMEEVLSASTPVVSGCVLKAAGGTAALVLAVDGAVICHRCAHGELTPLQAEEAGTEAVAKAGAVGLATYGVIILGANPVGITVIVVGGVVYVLVDYAIDELRSSYTSSPMTTAQIDEVMPIGWRRDEP